MRTLGLKSLFLLAMLGGVLLISGCFAIQSEGLTQPDVIGDVQIATTVCYSGSSSCPPTNDSSSFPSWVLLAYRVADGVTAPDSFKTTSGDSFTFNRDQSYTDSLTAKAPPPAGEHWVGYKAPMSPSTCCSWFFFVVKPRFGLPQGSDGSPFAGPFMYRTVTGWASGSNPVVCNDPPTTRTPGPNFVECIDAPFGADAYKTDQAFATRDLGLKGPPSLDVRAGESGVAAFNAQYAGPVGAGFTISATTDAPQVKVTPSTSTLSPDSGSSTPISVTVDVDPEAPLGTYDLTLHAKTSSGFDRTRTLKLVVSLGRPVATALPELTGTAAVGKTLTCSPGSWTGNPTSFAFQWTRENLPIAGATSNTYKLMQDDGALFIGCTVSATNAAGTGKALSQNVRAAQSGGADVFLNGAARASKDSTGLYAIDPGIAVKCPVRLPVDCGFSVTLTSRVTGSAAKTAASRTIRIGQAGFAAVSGQRLKVRMHLNRAGTKYLEKNGVLKVSAEVATRNHSLQRVTSRKHFTLRRPR